MNRVTVLSLTTAISLVASDSIGFLQRTGLQTIRAAFARHKSSRCRRMTSRGWFQHRPTMRTSRSWFLCVTWQLTTARPLGIHPGL